MGVVRLWTPRTRIEKAGALLVAVGAVAGGIIGSRYGAEWAVAGVFAGALALPVVAVVVALLVAAVGGFVRQKLKSGGESHGNG